MGREFDQKKLEGVLRENFVSAYLDYAMAFGEQKVQKAVRQAQETLRKIRR